MAKIFTASSKKTAASKSGEALNEDQKEKVNQKRNSSMIILTVILSGMIYYKIDKLENTQKTIITPYGSNSGDMLITGDNANASYVTGMLRLIISDFGSVSRGSIDTKFSELLAMVYPDRVEAVRKKLDERAEYFKSFNSVSELRELMTEMPRVITEHPDLTYKTSAPNKFRISFTANVRVIIGDSLKPDKPEKMHVDYTIVEGRFWILDIN